MPTEKNTQPLIAGILQEKKPEKGNLGTAETSVDILINLAYAEYVKQVQHAPIKRRKIHA
jgi:hypothetical protein